jgi:hypothetical protein
VPWLVLVASILLFSLSQWENWICGWQLQIFMLVVAVALAAWLRRYGRAAGWWTRRANTRFVRLIFTLAPPTADEPVSGRSPLCVYGPLTTLARHRRRGIDAPVPAEGRRDGERPRSGCSVSFRRTGRLSRLSTAEQGVCRAYLPITLRRPVECTVSEGFSC